MTNLLIALSLSLSLTACAADQLGSARRAILDTPSPLGRHQANRLKISMYLAGARAVLCEAWKEPAVVA